MHVQRKKQSKQQRRKDRSRRVVTAQQLNSKASTDEFQVARWVKICYKMKTLRFLNTDAQFFSSSNLVDRLLNTGFAMGNYALFTNREEVADFLHLMLAHDFFHRVLETKTAVILHPEQTFIDDPGEIYVWSYEPLYLGNWATLFLLYFSLSSIYIVHYWPDNLEKSSRNTFLVISTFFFIYMIMTLIRLALYYLVRWITNQNYEFMILPNLFKTVPFHKSLWPLCHFKYIGNQNISLKSNYSLFNIFDFYCISIGMFVILVLLHVLLCIYITYIFLVKKLSMTN